MNGCAFSRSAEDSLWSFRFFLVLLAKDICQLVDVVLVSRERTV
jgi:hypothetical protein